MHYLEFSEEDIKLVKVAYYFDFQTVETLTGLDREDVMQHILDFEDRTDEIGLGGYFNVLDVLADTFEYFSYGYNKPMYNSELKIHCKDYFSELSMMLDNEEDSDEHQASVGDLASFLGRVYNIFTIGVLFQMEECQVSFLADAVARYHDLPGYVDLEGCISFTEDSIIFHCFVPTVEDIHDGDNPFGRNFINRLLRKIPTVISGRRTIPTPTAIGY